MKNIFSRIYEVADKFITNISKINIGIVNNKVGAFKLSHPYFGIFSYGRKWWLLRVEPSSVSKGERIIIDFFGNKADSEIVTITLTLTPRKVTKRIIYLPWMPVAINGHIETNKRESASAILTLVPSTTNFSISHMSSRLRTIKNNSIHFDFSSITNTSPGNEIYYYYELLLLSEDSEDIKYKKYIEKIEPLLFNTNIDKYTDKVLFSIILPTYNSNISYLNKAINSVINQTYSNWELCIIDDASKDVEVKKTITRFSNNDKRIKPIFRDTNGHISIATNTGIDNATGDYVVFLDHDDELSPHALKEIAYAIYENKQLDIIYSDEDFIDATDTRCNPHFKSDWNPHLLCSHNYITHICAIKRSLINAVGKVREGLEGAQDYDLILRCCAITEPSNIYHIPKVLYHWRLAEGSTSTSSSEKSYSVKAGRTALEDYFKEKKISVKVTNANLPNCYRVNYPIQGRRPPRVSIFIPTKDNSVLLENCVESILSKTTYTNFEINIINNQSIKKETQDYFRRINNNQKINIIDYDKPFNFSAMHNWSEKNVSCEILGFLNNDTQVINSDWLDEIVSLAILPDTGCVGAKLYYDDNTIQHAGITVGLGGYAGHTHKFYHRDSNGYFNRLNLRQNVTAVTGACLFVRRNVFREVQGFDEKLAVAYNDVDLCLKVKQLGYNNIFTPYAELYHYESKTRGYENTPQKRARFEKEKFILKSKWNNLLLSDPYYNPNLSYHRDDFSIKEVDTTIV